MSSIVLLFRPCFIYTHTFTCSNGQILNKTLVYCVGNQLIFSRLENPLHRILKSALKDAPQLEALGVQKRARKDPGFPVAPPDRS